MLQHRLRTEGAAIPFWPQLAPPRVDKYIRSCWERDFCMRVPWPQKRNCLGILQTALDGCPETPKRWIQAVCTMTVPQKRIATRGEHDSVTEWLR